MRTESFLFSLYVFPFPVYLCVLCFRCVNWGYQQEFVLRRLQVRNEGTSLPAVFEDRGNGQATVMPSKDIQMR